jgi:2-oxoglutarate ferredoxin oxidoreductase subunit gamma
MKRGEKAGKRQEIIITGFGGQGIVLAGRILGEAAGLGDHLESTLVQSYGPEARGGACSAQVITSDEQIFYPYVRQPDILACLSQSGYEKFIDILKDNGTLLVDRDLVHPHERSRAYFAIPATRIAEELGHKMMANIIMLGFLVSITGAVSVDATKDAVSRSVPRGTEELNLKAFAKGCDFGLATLKGLKKKAQGQTRA